METTEARCRPCICRLPSRSPGRHRLLPGRHRLPPARRRRSLELKRDGQQALSSRATGSQEKAGLDVLVHGEPEQNDMVQYFAEQLTGYLATRHGAGDPGLPGQAARRRPPPAGGARRLTHRCGIGKAGVDHLLPLRPPARGKRGAPLVPGPCRGVRYQRGVRLRPRWARGTRARSCGRAGLVPRQTAARRARRPSLAAPLSTVAVGGTATTVQAACARQ
ncbi:hypothetical protein ABT247_06770 [Kitasatospora sp. NPDC001539]|uniref:hypothetical protein n=1 Tax=Kitasatospora sp. NPDC001539 TaxID=3154384 RepID=UPI003329B551